MPSDLATFKIPTPLEAALKKAGFYRPEQVRPVRELYLDARCELGAMLRKILRQKPIAGPGRGTKAQTAPSFSAELKRLQLQKDRARECQRASYLPLKERHGVYAEARRQEILATLDMLIEEAAPYWYKQRRKDRHRKIAAKAKAAAATFKIPTPFASSLRTFRSVTVTSPLGLTVRHTGGIFIRCPVGGAALGEARQRDWHPTRLTGRSPACPAC